MAGFDIPRSPQCAAHRADRRGRGACSLHRWAIREQPRALEARVRLPASIARSGMGAKRPHALLVLGVRVRLRPCGTARKSAKSMAPWQKWAARIIIAAVACFGAFSFAQLGLWQYLTGQVQFAYADYSVPLAFTFARYASIAILVTGVFHYIRQGIASIGKTGSRD